MYERTIKKNLHYTIFVLRHGPRPALYRTGKERGMTREEAIYELLNAFKYNVDDLFLDACNIAIEALKREDTMLKEIERVVLYGERSEE